MSATSVSARQATAMPRGLLAFCIVVGVQLTATVLIQTVFGAGGTSTRSITHFLLLAGGCGGQLFALGSWVAFGQGAAVLRLPAGMVLLLVAWYLFPLGLGELSTVKWELEEIVVLILWATFIFLASQLVLWPLRWLFGWRIMHGTDLEQHRPKRSYQIGILQMMGWSALVVAPLAACHLLVPVDDALIAMLFLSVGTAVAIGTCLSTFLIIGPDEQLPFRCVSLGMLLLLVGVIESRLIYHFVGWPPVSGGIVGSVTIWNLSLVGPILLTILLMRVLGYQLVKGS